MSTKTSIKRIALVAVSALGFGLLSVVPSSAANGLGAVTFTAASTSLNGAVGTAVSTEISFSTTNAAAASADPEEVITGTLTLVSKPVGSNVALNTSATHAADKATLTTLASGNAGWASAIGGGTAGQSVKSTPGASATAVGGKIATLALTADAPGAYVFAVTPTVGGGTPTLNAVTVQFNIGSYIDDATTEGKQLVCTVGTTIINNKCEGASGGRIGVLFTNLTLGTATTYFATVTGGSFVSATAKNTSGTEVAVANTNGLNLADGVTITQASSNVLVSEGVELLVTSATAGTATIRVETFNASTGVRTLVASGAVTFTSAAALDLATLRVYGIANATSCTTSIVANALTYMSRTAAYNTGKLCVYTLNGNGAVKTGTSITVTGNGIGQINNGAAVASETASANTDGISFWDLGGNGLGGTGTWTVKATDGVNTLTSTLDIKFFGSAASVSITQLIGGLVDGSSAVGYVDGTSDVATFTILDANGFPVAGGSTGNLVVDSDISSVRTIALAGDDDSSASESITASQVSNTGTHTTGKIDVDCSASMEAIKLKLHLASNTVASNEITVYCTSETPRSVTVNAVDSAVAVSQDVTATAEASITGKVYPVADQATITWSSTAGQLAATTSNFTLGTAKVSFASPLLAAQVTIKAVPSKTTVVTSASKVISVTAPVDPAVTAAEAATAAATKAGADAVAAANAAAAAAKAAGDAAVAAAEKAATDAVAAAKASQDAAVAAAKAAGDAAVAAAVKAALDAVAASKASQDAAVAEAQAATEAAGEAIDAANAATDAANIAADAADAATVAAEEARDAADAATAAVEELATQVSALFAALKAQVTTLANTVAKIAKKVKA
jgi:hypothetical protein